MVAVVCFFKYGAYLHQYYSRFCIFHPEIKLGYLYNV